MSAVGPITLESLSREFLRVCERAAVACARTMGQGERKHSDHVAVEAMRKAMDTIPMRGTVVIGAQRRLWAHVDQRATGATTVVTPAVR